MSSPKMPVPKRWDQDGGLIFTRGLSAYGSYGAISGASSPRRASPKTIANPNAVTGLRRSQRRRWDSFAAATVCVVCVATATVAMLPRTSTPSRVDQPLASVALRLLAIAPTVEIGRVDALLGEDRGHLGTVLGGVVDGLNEQGGSRKHVRLAAPDAAEDVIIRRLFGQGDQCFPTVAGPLAQLGNARVRIQPGGCGFAPEARRVARFGPDQVDQGGADGTVRPWHRRGQLFVAQLRADI